MSHHYVVAGSAGAAAAAEVLQDTGLVIINDAIGHALHSALLADLKSLLQQVDPNDPVHAAVADAAGDRIGISEEARMPGQTRRLIGLLGKSPTYGKLITSPLLAEICKIVLGPHCDSVQLHATAAMSVGPGAKKQSLHREEDSFPHFTPPRPPLVIACMAALTDFTEENGATRVVPGSHVWEDGRNATAHETIPAEMRAGSLLLWMGRTLHGAGANVTHDEWRTGVFASYSLGWLRQEENQHLATPTDVAAKLPDSVRALAGFGMYPSGLGYHEGNMSQ
jgi:ectoine hydroxylase-related dioxygenase (phytanoyl-CoA dioxygenase family)